VELTPAIIILLYFVGAILVVAELFIPGGITGTVGAILMGVSIYLTFSRVTFGIPLGIAMTAIAVVGLPIIILKAIEMNTLRKRLADSDGYVGSQEGLDALVGKEGNAVTTLRPAGMAQIGRRRVDVVAESGMVDKGAALRVVKVEGNRVVVRQTSAPPASPLSFT
jgi:membrane-bound serine protease (ClpP class)